MSQITNVNTKGENGQRFTWKIETQKWNRNKARLKLFHSFIVSMHTISL